MTLIIPLMLYVIVYEQLEETVYSMVMRYGLRLLKLRVLNAELKFIIRYVCLSVAYASMLTRFRGRCYKKNEARLFRHLLMDLVIII